MTRAEKETIIRFSEDPEEKMTVYTHGVGLARRMKRLGATLKTTGKIDGREISWTYECPSSWFRKPSKTRIVKELTPEQREALSTRMKARFAKP